MPASKAAADLANAAAASGLVLNTLPVPMFGVPLTVMCMAAFGSFSSFAYGQPEGSRKRLFTLAIVNTFLATIAVVVIPAWFGWTWVTPEIIGPVAAALGFLARFVIPPAIEAIPATIRGIFELIPQQVRERMSKLGKK